MIKLDNIEWLFFDKDSIVLQEGETIAFKWIDPDELRAMSRDNLATMRQLNFIEELT